MKEDLHELIDGTLPDEQAAELLHLLSVDPGKRSLFRQHLVLQRDLCRNERYAPMTALEEGEMLERVGRSIGLGTATKPTGLLRRGAAMLAIGFVLGSSVGYVGHEIVGKDPVATAVPDTVEVVRMVSAPAPTIDRDSLAAVIRDSLIAGSDGKSAPRGTVASTRKKTRSSTIDDPTGHQAARRLSRQKNSSR